MTADSWWWRAAGAVLLFGVLLVTFTVVDFEPDPVRLGLVVALGVAVAWLARDSLVEHGQLWTVREVRPIVPAGGDVKLASYVRLIENNLTARVPDRNVRDRLARLCDERLERRHGLVRGDPRADELLGADLVQALSGPPRRFGATEIDHYLTRIEEL